MFWLWRYLAIVLRLTLCPCVRFWCLCPALCFRFLFYLGVPRALCLDLVLLPVVPSQRFPSHYVACIHSLCSRQLLVRSLSLSRWSVCSVSCPEGSCL